MMSGYDCIVAMSKFDGHSDLHPVHCTHRSSTSNMRSPVSSSGGRSPDSADLSALARPRVECSSSRVTMKLGHMTPLVNLRHAPLPLQSSTDRAKPPSADRSSYRTNV